jgi:predicted  nucleic acid-binding Zn-ribbon protein
VAGKKASRASQEKTAAQGLRHREAAAKERLATLTATATVYRDTLDRMPAAEQLERGKSDAEAELDKAHGELASAKLSESEETVRARLDASNEGVRALQSQLSQTEREFHHLKGAMSQAEGLHQKRAAAAARVDELERQTERAMLESQAYDRLYALFEECREKQLGTVMGPIHDRVLRWMRLLRLSSYQAIRFNDQFLPEKLVAGDGAIEFGLTEESTGTIEQIALMVRLALGATLSTPEEPVVAVLDDPLTHSDVVRMGLMSAVIKNATCGDFSAVPPAGPLQIIVLTCHPEWFAIDGATMVDLSSPNVLTRSC